MNKKLNKIYIDFYNELMKYISSQQDVKDYDLNKDVTLNFVTLLRLCYGDNVVYQVVTILGMITAVDVKNKKIEIATKSKKLTPSYIS